MPLIRFAKLISLSENKGHFLKDSQFPHLRIPKLWDSKAVLTYLFQGCGFLDIAVGFCNCPLPPHLPHSQLSSCPMWTRVVFEATTWDNLFGKQTQLLTIRDLHTHWALCSSISQRSCEPILSCQPETGTEWASNQISKRGRRDSPYKHQGGSDL